MGKIGRNKLFSFIFLLGLSILGGGLLLSRQISLQAREINNTREQRNQLISDELMTKAEVKIANLQHRPGQEYEKEINNDIITAFELNLEFAFPNKSYEAGDYYETILPTVFRIEALSGSLSDGRASYTYEPTTHKLRLTFNQKIDGSTIDLWKIGIIASLQQYPLEEKAEKSYAFSFAPEEKYYLRFYDRRNSEDLKVNTHQPLNIKGEPTQHQPHSLKIGRTGGNVYYLFDGTVAIDEVPEAMTFDAGKISLLKQDLLYQGPDKFKLDLKDTRLYNPRNTANSLRGKLEDQPLTELGATIYKQTVANQAVQIPVLMDDLDRQTEQGLRLEVPRGSQIRKVEYQAVLSFELIAGP